MGHEQGITSGLVLLKQRFRASSDGRGGWQDRQVLRFRGPYKSCSTA